MRYSQVSQKLIKPVLILLFVAGFMDTSVCQTIIGRWEGTFMQSFKVIIGFEKGTGGVLTGNIEMYKGASQLQNDPLDIIELDEHQVRFTIPAKSTRFIGSISEQNRVISGNLIFPDKSKHKLVITKLGNHQVESSFYARRETPDLSKEMLTEDLDSLYFKLIETHPSPFSFIDKEDFDLLLFNLKSQLWDRMSLSDFLLIASQLSHSIQCSHTGIRMPKSWQAQIRSKAGVFPLQLFFQQGHAYSMTPTDSSIFLINAGDEILKINGMTIPDIIDKISVLIPVEGNNTTRIYHQLNKKFNTLYYHLDSSKYFTVQFRDTDRINEANVQATIPSALNFMSEANLMNLKEPEFELIQDHRAGRVTIPSFAIQDMDHYLDQLNDFFSTLKNNSIDELIVDLRDNEGGHPIFAAQLLSYLVKEDFVYFKRNNEVTEFEPLYKSMPPNMNAYDGSLYVLINGGCLSTTGHLISLLKHYTPAKFIGESPGSTYKCNDQSTQFLLPNSQLEVNIPRQIFETTHAGFDILHPFPIDYEISHSIADILCDKDPYLNYISQLLSRKKNNIDNH